MIRRPLSPTTLHSNGSQMYRLAAHSSIQHYSRPGFRCAYRQFVTPSTCSTSSLPGAQATVPFDGAHDLIL